MQPQVVVVGGGFGGLEAAFLLRQRLGERVGITLASDRDDFTYRPGAVYVPFGLDPRSLVTPLPPALRRRNIGFVHGRAVALDLARRELRVAGADGEVHRLGYDYLVVATGAEPRLSEVPGLEMRGLGLWAMREALAMRRAFASLARASASGQRREVLLVVPPGNRWPAPIYELALMLDWWLRHHEARSRVGITLATHEHSFLHALGSRIAPLVQERFAERDIIGLPRTTVEAVGARAARVAGGAELPYDLVISSPAQVAAVPFPELPRDTRGFVLAASGTRQVLGAPGVFAVGDASSFPVKQALVAVRQAGAAVEQVVAEVTGREAREFRPQGILLMDGLDKASFAEVPLREDGEPPVDLGGVSGTMPYRVGTSSAWRLAKRFVGAYVPWRFGQGLPCHGGLSGAAVDAGLRLMAGTLAR